MQAPARHVHSAQNVQGRELFLSVLLVKVLSVFVSTGPGDFFCVLKNRIGKEKTSLGALQVPRRSRSRLDHKELGLFFFLHLYFPS